MTQPDLLRTPEELEHQAEALWGSFGGVGVDSAEQPLAGVRVLELSGLLPGPVATRALADLGGHVLKVERPDGGDALRVLMPRAFEAINRNKRSLALDLKDSDAQRFVSALAATADVVIEGFRPGVVKRLSCDPDTLRAVNPRLVYCSISGYGQDSLRRAEPGHDLNYLAIAGALSSRLGLGEPSVALPSADMLAASQAGTAICAALLRVARTGRGAYIDLSMTDCVVSGLSHLINEQAHAGPTEAIGRHPAYGVFTAADEIRLAIGCTETNFYVALCRELGLDDLLAPELLDYGTRRARWHEIERRIADVIGAREGLFWLRTLAAAGLPITEVNTLASVLDDPDLSARGVARRIGGTVQVPFPALFNGRRPGHRTDAPELGELDIEVMAEP